MLSLLERFGRTARSSQSKPVLKGVNSKSIYQARSAANPSSATPRESTLAYAAIYAGGADRRPGYGRGEYGICNGSPRRCQPYETRSEKNLACAPPGLATVDLPASRSDRPDLARRRIRLPFRETTLRVLRACFALTGANGSVQHGFAKGVHFERERMQACSNINT